MKYEAIDKWSSPYLVHYGIKGMKWGVRKSVERTGRVVRKMGGAVKNSASRIAGGLVRTGSAVRRFKNRRAIKSANANRIQSRVDKMSTQELTDAVTRAHLVNQLNNNGQHHMGIIETNARNVANNFVRNSMESALSSIIGGEKFTDSMVKRYGGRTASEKANDAAQKYADFLKRQSANSTNILRTLENNKKISDFNNANSAVKPPKVQSIKVKTTKVSSIKNSKSASSGYNFVRKSLYSNNTNIYSWQDSKYTRMGNDYLDYVNRLNHSDMFVSDFLAHYGVKGMKWGVRKVKERLMYGRENDSLNRKINRIYAKRNRKDYGKAELYENMLVKRSIYSDKVSFPKAVARRLLYGKQGAINYNKIKSVDNRYIPKWREKEYRNNSKEANDYELLNATFDKDKDIGKLFVENIKETLDYDVADGRYYYKTRDGKINKKKSG